MCVCVCVPWSTCGDQRTASCTGLSPPPLCSFWGLNSGSQAGTGSALPDEQFFRPQVLCLKYRCKKRGNGDSQESSRNGFLGTQACAHRYITEVAVDSGSYSVLIQSLSEQTLDHSCSLGLSSDFFHLQRKDLCIERCRLAVDWPLFSKDYIDKGEGELVGVPRL